ncbi:hypothetical protein D3C72_1616370 [compost metagenome]
MILRGADPVLKPSLPAIEQAIQYLGLLGRQTGLPVRLPEAGFAQHPLDPRHGLLQAAQQGLEKPLQPFSDVQSGFLTVFQYAVIARAIFEDARRHGVKANRLGLALSQCKVGDGASQAAIAVIKRVKRDEPEMCDPGPQ